MLLAWCLHPKCCYCIHFREYLTAKSGIFCQQKSGSGDIIWLVVWTPLKNISQLGWLFPIYGNIKNVPNHQPVICRCTVSPGSWKHRFCFSSPFISLQRHAPAGGFTYDTAHPGFHVRTHEKVTVSGDSKLPKFVCFQMCSVCFPATVCSCFSFCLISHHSTGPKYISHLWFQAIFLKNKWDDVYNCWNLGSLTFVLKPNQTMSNPTGPWASGTGDGSWCSCGRPPKSCSRCRGYGTMAYHQNRIWWGILENMMLITHWIWMDFGVIHAAWWVE